MNSTHPTHTMDTSLIPTRCSSCLATSGDPVELALPCVFADQDKIDAVSMAKHDRDERNSRGPIFIG